MIAFVLTSIKTSFIDCVVLLVFGGVSLSASYYLTKAILETNDSVYFYIIYFSITFLLSWISIFWIKILFIPANRGKISVFSPFPINSIQISFKNDGLIPTVAGCWLSCWLLIVSVGWICGIRENSIYYRTLKIKNPIKPCCGNIKTNFTQWFHDEYLPKIKLMQNKPIESRKFILFQPLNNVPFEEKLFGLYTSFALSIISSRELIIEYQQNEFPLKSPGWEWNFSKIFETTQHSKIIDLSTRPSFIVPDSHQWKWAELLNGDINNKILQSNQIILIDCNEFLAPLIWANPTYKNVLCQICTPQEIYSAFSSVFLHFDKKFTDMVNIYQPKSNYSLIITDYQSKSHVKTRAMLDTIIRCISHETSENEEWVVVNIGSISNFPSHQSYGGHKVSFYNLEKLSITEHGQLYNSAVHIIGKKANKIIGFTGSSLAQSVAYSNKKPLLSVHHHSNFCGEESITIPCIKMWKFITNVPELNLGEIFNTEMFGYDNCYV